MRLSFMGGAAPGRGAAREMADEEDGKAGDEERPSGHIKSSLLQKEPTFAADCAEGIGPQMARMGADEIANARIRRAS
jgi:hypothetical protein